MFSVSICGGWLRVSLAIGVDVGIGGSGVMDLVLAGGMVSGVLVG